MSRSTAHDLRNDAFREGFSSIAKAKELAPPTSRVIEDHAKARKVEHHDEEVPNSDGARLHWLGDRSADKVILYLHGGGFALPAFEGHVIFLNQCVEHMSLAGQNTIVAFLEYTLTPVRKYPVQHVQATEALRLILEKGFKPSNIIIGGDSAGGNLAIALVSNIMHPPTEMQPLKLEGNLAGLLLISPWVSFETKANSYEENKLRDIFTLPVVDQLIPPYVHPGERNNWSEPSLADASWWIGMPVRKILNVYGSYEMFKDDIAVFGRTLERAGCPVETVECPLQVHIDCILDAQTGSEVGLMSLKIWEWLSKVY